MYWRIGLIFLIGLIGAIVSSHALPPRDPRIPTFLDCVHFSNEDVSLERLQPEALGIRCQGKSAKAFFEDSAFLTLGSDQFDFLKKYSKRAADGRDYVTTRLSFQIESGSKVTCLGRVNPEANGFDWYECFTLPSINRILLKALFEDQGARGGNSSKILSLLNQCLRESRLNFDWSTKNLELICGETVAEKLRAEILNGESSRGDLYSKPPFSQLLFDGTLIFGQRLKSNGEFKEIGTSVACYEVTFNLQSECRFSLGNSVL